MLRHSSCKTWHPHRWPDDSGGQIALGLAFHNPSGRADACHFTGYLAELRAVYAEVFAKAVELRWQGKTHMEACEQLNQLSYRTRTGKPWRHPQQIVKLLRSFAGA